LLCILQKTNGEVKLGFNGDLYPSITSSVLSTKGDIVRYNTERERYGIGSTNQILQVKSALPSWETVDLADTVLTTAGDVLIENATPELARVGAGTQYYNFQMGSALPAWSASSTSILTGAQDILYSSASNTLARLSAGTDGDVLTTHGVGSAITWETVSAGATVTVQNISPAGGQTTTSTALTDLTDGDVTLPTRANGFCFMTFYLSSSHNALGQVKSGININGSDEATNNNRNDNAGATTVQTVALTDALDGGTVQLRFATNTGTVTVRNDSASLEESNCPIIEIS